MISMTKNGTSIQCHEMAFQDVQSSYAGDGIPRTPTYWQKTNVVDCSLSCRMRSYVPQSNAPKLDRTKLFDFQQ